MKQIWKRALALACVGITLGCNDSDPQTDVEALKKDLIENYSDIVLASYEDSLTSAQALQGKLNAFVANPTAEGFTEAKQAWLASREPYGQTEAYRFYEGPIDNAVDGPEGFLNAWPLDEAYIDYVIDDQEIEIIHGGLINSDDLLDEESLRGFNEDGGERNISTGYHAIEFLLWGQDLNAQPEDAGLRPYTDYVEGGTAESQLRRGEYLALVGDILVKDLDSLRAAWAKDTADNYRAQFLALDSDEALRRLMVGMASLARAELSGERMKVALETREQEDEHSCFSDNTHRDIVTNLQGIENIYYGRYRRLDNTEVSGAGLRELVEAVDPELENQLTAELESAHDAVAHLDMMAKEGIAFDRQIVDPEHRPHVQEAIDALVRFGDLMPEAAQALGINLQIQQAE